jgi:hypothetical protein
MYVITVYGKKIRYVRYCKNLIRSGRFDYDPMDSSFSNQETYACMPHLAITCNVMCVFFFEIREEKREKRSPYLCTSNLNMLCISDYYIYYDTMLTESTIL